MLLWRNLIASLREQAEHMCDEVVEMLS